LPDDDTLPVYLPDGPNVFRSGRNNSRVIRIMNGDGSNQQLIVPNVPVSHIEPVRGPVDVKWGWY